MAFPVHAQNSYTGQTIEEILELPESDINIGIASLVLAKEFYPDMNVNFFLQTFDYLADRYIYFFGEYADPDERIRALNTYLYRPGFWNDSITFCYDDDDLHVTKLENKFINGYISTKKGSCITMPMLYVILGERLGFPIYPVRSAKHFFVRYVLNNSPKSFKQNIEATNGGGHFSDKEYKEDVLLPENSIKNGVYLRTLTKKEYIASLLLTNANEYIRIDSIEKAKHYLELSMKYDSTFSSAYWNYGLTLFGEARQLEDSLYENKQKVIEDYNKFVSQEGVNQDRITEEQANTMRWVQEINEYYEPLILAKIEEYKRYKNKARELGIVLEYPLEFFKKQSESIEKFKKQGGY